MKAVATVMAHTPVLTIRLGLGYLGLKRQAKRGAKEFKTGLLEGGMPPELASQLAEQYELELSITNLMKSTGVSRFHLGHLPGHWKVI